MSLVDRPALVDVLGETLVLVVGRALLVVDHVTDGPVHRGTLQFTRSAEGLVHTNLRKTEEKG